MAILINLERQPYTTLNSEINTRIDVGLQALQHYMHGYFEPTDLEVWERAPVAELDGVKLHSIQLNVGDHREVRKKIDEFILGSLGNNYNVLSQTIIRINGNWDLDGKPRGFFSINNFPLWNRAYGDVDADLSPEAKEEDLTKLFWKDVESRNHLVDKFFESFLHNYETYNFRPSMKLNWIAFGSGIPTRYDISQIRAAYYSSMKALVSDAFETFREKREDVQKSLRVGYIVDKAFREPIFRTAVVKTLEKFRISSIKGHSIMLIGKEQDSFYNLYNELSSEYLAPLFKKLPKDEQVNDTIREVVTKHKSLYSYDLNAAEEDTEDEE